MAIKTKKTILNTFQEMLEEMPFDKITVTELTKRAEISHNTFYYHYEDMRAFGQALGGDLPPCQRTVKDTSKRGALGLAGENP